MPPSPFVDAAIHRWIERLSDLTARIERCSVTVELPHRRQRQGATFHVHVSFAGPGIRVAASRDHDLDGTHENVYVAIAHAFRAARRQLLQHAEQRREYA